MKSIKETVMTFTEVKRLYKTGYYYLTVSKYGESWQELCVVRLKTIYRVKYDRIRTRPLNEKTVNKWLEKILKE